MSTISVENEAGNRKEINTLFPVFLKLEKLNLLLVGGGNVALEKLGALFNNSPAANVKLVGKEINPAVASFLKIHHIPFEERAFVESDLQGMDLAIIAINEKSVSAQIQTQCKANGVLTNVADTPDYCDFYLGSVVQKGNLKIAISTNGKSPTIAKRVKEVLNDTFPEEMNDLLDNMQKIRNSLSGDFSDKVKQLNSITSVLATDAKPDAEKRNGFVRILLFSILALGLMVLGHFLFSYIFSKL